ncbi:MAG: hypothetical protein L6W00_18620 [Lentisphaeria bacterium]|nr:MAG: hypothetical protein L6W00_18620 [Lentisphaeria bacterium]
MPGLLFTLKIRNGEDGSFRFRPALSGIPADLLPDFIEAPHIAIPLNHELFYPFSEGVIVSEREKRNRKVQHIEFPRQPRHRLLSRALSDAVSRRLAERRRRLLRRG